MGIKNYSPGFGMRICQARRHKGLTQAQLCDLVGCAPVSLSHWENEKKTLQAESWWRLAQALQVSEHWLRHGTVEPVHIPATADLGGIPIELLICELSKRGYGVIVADKRQLVETGMNR